MRQTRDTFVKGKILNTLWKMKTEGNAKSTIKATDRRLRMIAKTVNIDDPESVKRYIALKECKNSYKEGQG